MTRDEFDAWRPRSVRGAAAQLAEAGLLPVADATTWAQGELDRLLPGGVDTPGHLLRTIRSGEPRTSVGHLWTWLRPGVGEVEAFLVDVEILPEHRGKGLGGAAVLTLERAASGLGATVVRLNVHTHNRVAVRLYERLGYGVTGMTVSRRLDTAPRSGQPGPVVSLGALTEADRAPLVGAGVDPDAVLPVGRASAGHRLWAARDDAGRPVAVVRLRVTGHSEGRDVTCQHLEVVAGRRRQGFGRAVVRAVEDRCRQAAVASVTMTVTEPTEAARLLAARSGYRVAAQTMAKKLTDPGVGPVRRRPAAD